MPAVSGARSLLFVPASRPDRFAKALHSGADCIILDLEDAVAPADKDQARAAVVGWLHVQRPVIVRINGADTPWFRDDCELAGLPGVSGVMLPKAERFQDVLQVAGAAGKVAVLPLIETAAGYDNIRVIASTKGVQRLIFGSIDFQLDLGIAGDDLELLMFRSGIVLTSRVCGLQSPVDGVSTGIADMAGVRADAERASRLGFGAKLCIHPKQVEVVNTAFAPTGEEIAWASRVIAAAASANGAAVAVDGKMVDRPVLVRAQRIVAEVAYRSRQRQVQQNRREME